MKLPFDLLRDIDGWLDKDQPEALADLAAAVPAGGRILEIGSFHGLSTVCLCHGAKLSGATVWCCDTFNGSAEHAWIKADHLTVWRDNVLRKGFTLPVALVGRSQDILPMLAVSSFDLCFIDACHDYDAVLSDYAQAKELVKAGGVVAFHDVNTTWPEVARVWNELAVNELEPLGQVGSLCWGRRRP